MKIEKIGENIDNLRKSKGMSTRRFAGVIGYTDWTVNQWIHGRNTPHAEALCIISEKFGIPIESLFEGVMS